MFSLLINELFSDLYNFRTSYLYLADFLGLKCNYIYCASCYHLSLTLLKCTLKIQKGLLNRLKNWVHFKKYFANSDLT